MFSGYVRLLKSNPISVNLGSAFVIATTGDLIAQQVEHDSLPPPPNPPASPPAPHSPDLHRTLEMVSWSIFGLTPINMLQQGFVAERLWPVWSPASVAAKVLLCVVVAPVNNSVFFGFKEGYTALRDHLLFEAPAPTLSSWSASASREIEGKLWDTVLMSWQGWTGVNFVNFYFVPNHGRHLFTSFFAVGWMSYLSYKGHAKLVAEGGGEGGGETDAAAVTKQLAAALKV